MKCDCKWWYLNAANSSQSHETRAPSVTNLAVYCKWQCPVTCLTWFLFCLKSCLILLAEDCWRNRLARWCRCMNFQSSWCLLFVQFVVALFEMLRTDTGPMNGYSDLFSPSDRQCHSLQNLISWHQYHMTESRSASYSGVCKQHQTN